jgi:nitrite reductase/ring-hydroxylating ferredoxin subunit
VLSDLPFRGGRLFEAVVDGLDLVVFRLGGRTLAAYDAACPHVGAQLRPENEIRGVLTCTMHQWRFEVATGCGLDGVPCDLVAHAVELRGTEVWVSLTPRNPRLAPAGH